MFSIIYTPTEGDAIQNYSRLFRKPEGCFLNINDQDSIDLCLSNFGEGDDIDYIVVSDGEEVGLIFSGINIQYLTTILSDPRNRRPRRWGNPHLGRQVGDYHALRWNSSITTVTGRSGLRDRCTSFSSEPTIIQLS